MLSEAKSRYHTGKQFNNSSIGRIRPLADRTIKIFIFLISSLLSHISFSQNTYYFNKLYDNDSLSDGLASVNLHDSGYIVVGISNDVFNPVLSQSLFIIRADNYGNSIDKQLYGKLGYTYDAGSGFSLIKTKDGGYVSGGTLQDTIDRQALLVKYASDGSVQWISILGDSTKNEVAYVCRQTSDGGFVLIGFSQIVKPSLMRAKLYVVKTDSMGVFQWDTTYSALYDATGSTIEQTMDGGFIIGGYYGINSSTGRSWIIKTDSIGNIKWDKKINVNEPAGCSVFQSMDGNYIIYTLKDNLDGNGDQGYISKLDSGGITILWEKTYGSTKDDWFERGAIELADGSIIASGVTLNNPNNRYWGWIVKMNSDGDSIWSQMYNTSDIYNHIYDIASTVDGGFIFSGDAVGSSDFGDDIWLVKTDSNGNTCSFAGCDSVNTGIEEVGSGSKQCEETEIFPNPFSQNAVVRIPDDCEFANGKVELRVYNLLGQEVHPVIIRNSDSFVISRSNLVAGIYFYQVKNKDGMLASGKFVISD